MSHHAIDMLPGVIPAGRPAKLDRKKRLRKARAALSAQGIDGIDIDDVFGPLLDRLEAAAEDDWDDMADDAGSSQLGLLSGHTMQTLLKAQEEA